MAEEWSEDELEALCDAYFAMLENESLGLPYVKTHHNGMVQKATGRTSGSIEFKFGNLSAVLSDLGQQWIRGYLPRSHYQKLMKEVVERRLNNSRADGHASRSPLNPAESESGGVDEALVGQIEWDGMQLTQLLKRSFGGGNVAIGQKADTDTWPLAAPAAGADEAREIFCRELEESSGDLSWLIFLGGPGNGKSELARRIQNFDGLELTSAGELKGHRRSTELRYKSGRSVKIVNDATIRTGGASLMSDIESAFREHQHLVLNVNRGVLVEDLQSVSSSSIEPLGEWLINFLLDPTVDRKLLEFEIQRLGDHESIYLQQVLLKAAETTIRLRVVRLDVCSLFEPRPATKVSGNLLEGGKYRISRLNDRLNLDLSTIPALELISQTLEDLPSGAFEDPRFDVIGANLTTLRASGVVHGVGTVMRAAELVESRLFTFREVWGAISLLVLGPLTPDDERLDRYLAECSAAKRSSNDPDLSARDRLASLLPLSRYRFTQALFSEPPMAVDGTVTNPSRMTPVTQRLQAVDPAIDAIPGSSLDMAAGWASPVMEAMDEAQFGGSPISRISDEDELFRHAVTPFDIYLEKELFAYCWDPKTRDNEHDSAMAWFGRYLLRLYAITHGIPAFACELLSWTRAWTHAEASGNLGNELGMRVKMLLVPPFASEHAGGEVLVLPAFAPQTVPLIEGTDEPVAVACFQSNQLSTRASVFGDRLKVGLMFENENILSLDFDFPLLREAMTSEGKYSGATELGARSTPRLERARASLLSSRSLASSWGVVDGVNFISFSVSEAVD